MKSNITRSIAFKHEDDAMSFAVPYKLFCEVEENVDGSFLERGPWRELTEMEKQ